MVCREHCLCEIFYTQISRFLLISFRVVPLELPRFSSSTRSTTPVPVLPTTTSRLPRGDPDNSTDWSTSTGRPLLPTVLPVSTEDSSPPSLVSLSTVVSTLVSVSPTR